MTRETETALLTLSAEGNGLKLYAGRRAERVARIKSREVVIA
jgi:hypothetical protein